MNTFGFCLSILVLIFLLLELISELQRTKVDKLINEEKNNDYFL